MGHFRAIGVGSSTSLDREPWSTGWIIRGAGPSETYIGAVAGKAELFWRVETITVP